MIVNILEVFNHNRQYTTWKDDVIVLFYITAVLSLVAIIFLSLSIVVFINPKKHKRFNVYVYVGLVINIILTMFTTIFLAVSKDSTEDSSVVAVSLYVLFLFLFGTIVALYIVDLCKKNSKEDSLLTAKLNKLIELKSQGYLTEDEFSKFKQDLLKKM